jgi:hypothetical protein
VTDRADRMAALERLAAPGSGATEPERETARRILERMQAEAQATDSPTPEDFRRAAQHFENPMGFHFHYTDVHEYGSASVGQPPGFMRSAFLRWCEQQKAVAAAAATTAEDLANLAELLGYAPRGKR